MDLNNRELASLLLLGSFALYVAWQSSQSDSLRSSLGGVVRAFTKPAIVAPFTAAAVWIVMLIRGGRRLGAWDLALAYDTALWVATLAIVAMVGVSESLRDRRYVRKVVLRTVEVGVLLELLINLYVFPLPVEIVLQLLVVTVSCLIIYGKYHLDKYRQVVKFLEGVSALIGFGVMAYVAYRLYGGWRDLDASGLLRAVALPVWLTLGFAPFLLGFSFYVAYDKLVRLVWHQTRHSRAARARGVLAMLVALRGSRIAIGSANLYVARDVAAADSFAEARRVAVEWRTGHDNRVAEVRAER